jgi:hypothetical protein
MKEPTKVILPEVLTNEMLSHFVPVDTELFCATITAELTRRVNEMDIGEYVKMELDRLISIHLSNYLNRSNYKTLIGNAVGRLVVENLSISVTKKED